MFTEALELELTLTIGSQSVTVPGGHIDHFAVELTPYGFTAEVTFWSPALYRGKDDLFDPFKSLDVARARLSIQGVYNLPDTAPDPIVVQGLVTRKWVTESAYGQVSSSSSYHRRYRIELADTARVLWRQHYPCVLLTDDTLKSLIDAQKPEGMNLEYDWDALTEAQPLLCLGLDADTSEASFYDFLMWYVRAQSGVFTYDGATDTYSLTETKASIEQTATLSPFEVEEVEVAIPETIRYSMAVLNADAENPDNQAVDQDQAVTGVRRDVLLRTPVPAEIDARVALEASRLAARQPTLEVRCKSFPTIAVTPGSGVTFDQDEWSMQTSWLTETYRVTGVSIRGDAADAADAAVRPAVDKAHTAYATDMTMRLELADETHVELPRSRRPSYPIHVEGKVVSTSGADSDKTYQIEEDEDTSLSTYTVHIPLWDKEVSAPLLPLGQPGHFYFPAFRDQRVLVALDFMTARIVRFLDFGARTRLATDTQGNHILFGQNESSETSMRYAYEDDKSLFEIKRVMDSDNVLLEMKEGLMVLEVKEDEGE